MTATPLELTLGRRRGERIRQEIEDRRPRIRRAAALAEVFVRASGSEPIVPTTRRPHTVAGIAVLRAERIQKRGSL